MTKRTRDLPFLLPGASTIMRPTALHIERWLSNVEARLIRRNGVAAGLG
jgi:hypothetical protein